MLSSFLPNEKQEYKNNLAYTRLLTDNYSTIPYHIRRNQFKFALHDGQRKLLIGDIEFIVANYELASVYVCAGAAQGYHYKILSELFPDIEFHLYDPNPFWKGLYDIPNIHIYQEYWTDAVCQTWLDAGTPVLFSSDIRTPPESGELNFGDTSNPIGSNSFEKKITGDMKMQQDWVLKLKPAAAMLKFRLPYCHPNIPYDHEYTRYLDGKVLFQAWAPPSSTECRLWCYPNSDGSYKTRLYDNKKYEDQMFRFNMITRVQWYDLGPINAEWISLFPGYEYNYDSATEVRVLLDYIAKFKSHEPVMSNLASIWVRINEISGTTIHCSPHGDQPLKPFHEKTPPKTDATKDRFHNRFKSERSNNRTKKNKPRYNSKIKLRPKPSVKSHTDSTDGWTTKKRRR